MLYANAMDFKVTNNSWSGTGWNNNTAQAFSNVLAALLDDNQLFVAAAGNDSSNIDRYETWPASYDSESLLVIASTTKYGSLSGFSNYGVVGVDVAAPGSSIYSTTPGNRYGNMSGTSMATPNTVGVAAQILSLNPGLSPYQLKERLMERSTKVSKYSTKVGSSGLVNLLDSIR